ncbi:MAG: T9SS type A sorting domain-containing protein [Candidatus Kapabacteria bacterium]|nr:T9SS type A sorting domain-containing protein [Candidatus Kapabacteria bacterium]
MLKRVPVLLFLLATMIISTLSLNAATNLWVSTTGNDGNNGHNINQPLRTISKALSKCTNSNQDYIINVVGNTTSTPYYVENIVISSNLKFKSLQIIGIGDFVYGESSPNNPKVDPDNPTPQYGYSSRIHGLEGDEPTIAIYHSNVTIKNLRILNLKRSSEDLFSENNKRNVLIYIAPGLENVEITQNNIGPQTGDGTIVNIYYDLSYEEEDEDPIVYTGGTHGIFVDGSGTKIKITENEINGISGLGDAIRFEANGSGFDDCTIQYNLVYNLRMSHLVVLGKMTNSLIGNNVCYDAGFYDLKFELGGAVSIGEGAFGNGIVLLNNSSSNISNIDIIGNSIAINLHTGLYIYGGVDDIYVNGNDFYLNMDAITLNGDNGEPFFPGDEGEIGDNNYFNEVVVYRNVIYANTRFGIFNNTDYALCAQENYFEEPNEDFELGGFDYSNGPQYAWGEFDHTLYYFDGDNFDGGRTFYNEDAVYQYNLDRGPDYVYDPNVVPGASMIYGKIDFSPYTYDLSDYSTRNITVDNSNPASEFDNIANAMLAVHSVCDDNEKDVVEVVKTNTNYSEQFTIYYPVELKGINGTPIIDPTTGPIITSVSAGDSKISGFQFNIPTSGGLGFIDENEDYTGNVFMVNNSYYFGTNQLTAYTGSNGVDQYIADDMDYTSNPTRGSDVVGQFIFDFPVALAKNIEVEIGSGGTNGEVKVFPSQINNGSFDFECLITNSCSSDLTFTILYDSDNNGTPEEYDATNGLTLTAIGTYTVKLKVCNPEDGNCDISEDVTITVEDNTQPNANAQNITVQTGTNGSVTIDPEDLDDGSTDNSGGTLTFTIIYNGVEYGPGTNAGNLSFSVPGTYSVQLKVCDESDNCATDNAKITVEDNTPPIAKGKDITVQLGQDGTVTITPQDVDDGSSDNSGTVYLSFCDEDGGESLTFDAPGTYEVNLCVEDPSGNQSSVTVLVTVLNYPINSPVLWLDAGTTSQKCKGSKLPLSPPNTWSWQDLTQYNNHAKQQYKDNIPHTLPKKVGSTKKRGIFFNEHYCNEKNSDFLKVANASGNLNNPNYDKSIFVVFTTKNNIGDKCNCKEYNHKHDSKCKHEDEQDDDEDCGRCSGGVTKLTLKYTGNSANIKIVQKDGQILYNSYVYKNSTFSFTGKGSYNKMGTEIKIYVNNIYYNYIHTSCSQPIGPGLTVGNFTVVSGESYKGGNLCSINSGGDDGDDDDDKDKGKGSNKCKMVIFEMGGTSSGVNFYIEDGKFYAGVWGNGKSHFRSFNISRKTTYMARLRYNSGTDRFDVYLNNSGHEGVGTVELKTDNSDNGIGAAVDGTRFHDGSFSGTGKFFDGYIGEIIVHNSADGNIWESTKDYLCTKYGFGNNCNNNWKRENEEYVEYQMNGEVEIFDAYPNPFELQSNFSMAVRQSQPVTIELFNALGEKVQTIFRGNLEGQTYYEFNIDGSNLPSGIYIYKVSGATFTRSGKVILNK